VTYSASAIGAALLVLAVGLAAASRRGDAFEAADAAKVKTGVWSGEHARLEVAAGGATIEYDCGRGTIDEPLVLDAQGRFAARGRHVPEHGGPERRDEPAPPAARYTGRVSGDHMTLTVAIDGQKDPLGPFTLTHGADVALMKCR
jgi:hypothetical protein